VIAAACFSLARAINKQNAMCVGGPNCSIELHLAVKVKEIKHNYHKGVIAELAEVP
jgi:hypothetical protein